MTKLRVGVIGLGMGRGHVKGYLQHPDVELVAVADQSPDRETVLKSVASGFSGKIYDDGLEMIRSEKFDIVSVAVPNFLHKKFTIAALEAGANVLCEKPMAMNAAEAEEMLATAKRCNRKLGINFSYRFYPQSRAMKDLVDAGKLGDVYYARSEWLRRRGVPGMSNANFNTGSSKMGSWFFLKDRSGGGPLIDLGVHRLDLALWLMGYPEPDWVMGSICNKIANKMAKSQGIPYTVEDFACASIRFKNGAMLELSASWASNIKEHNLMTTRILGDQGGLYHYNLNEGYSYAAEFYSEVAGNHYDAQLHVVDDSPSAYWLFADAVKNNTDFLVKPEEGVTVMKILDAIYRASETGQPVKL